MRRLRSALGLACAAVASLSLGAMQATAAGGVVGGSYQDDSSRVCTAAQTCRLNLSAMQFATRLTSVSCQITIDDPEPDPFKRRIFVFKELVLGQTDRAGGLVYLAPIQVGQNYTDDPKSVASFQVYVDQPNYGIGAGSKPYVKAIFHKPINSILNCAITGE